MKELLYNANNVYLNYVEVYGDGPPLLLLHGGSSRWQCFQDIIPEFTRKFYVYALDLRGHGKSSRVKNGYEIENYVQDIVEFIKHRVKKPPIIFGHSLGGQIAIMLAAYHPELVQSLIVGDSPLSLSVIYDHFKKQQSMTIQWREWARSCSVKTITENLKNMIILTPDKNQSVRVSEIFGENHPWFEFMGVSLSQNDPEMLTSIIDDYIETFKAYGMDKLLPLIQCPVLLLRGGENQGSLISDIDAEKALKLLAKGQEKKISHVGHALFMQDKEAVIKIMLEFIEANEIRGNDD